jgi:formylmethanofuran dehydrogenase subunit C
MDAGGVESMLYNKYEVGEEKEKYMEVRMRDGSIVMRKIE